MAEFGGVQQAVSGEYDAPPQSSPPPAARAVSPTSPPQTAAEQKMNSSSLSDDEEKQREKLQRVRSSRRMGGLYSDAGDGIAEMLKANMLLSQSFLMSTPMLRRKSTATAATPSPAGLGNSGNGPSMRDDDDTEREPRIAHTPSMLRRKDTAVTRPVSFERLDRLEIKYRNILQSYLWGEMMQRVYYKYLHETALRFLQISVQKKISILLMSQESWWRRGFHAIEFCDRLEYEEEFYRMVIKDEFSIALAQHRQHDREQYQFMCAHEMRKERLRMERQELRERRFLIIDRDIAQLWVDYGIFSDRHRVYEGMYLLVLEFLRICAVHGAKELGERREMENEEREEFIEIYSQFAVPQCEVLHQVELELAAQEIQQLFKEMRAMRRIGIVALGLLRRKEFCRFMHRRHRERAVELLHRVAKSYFVRHYSHLQQARLNRQRLRKQLEALGVSRLYKGETTGRSDVVNGWLHDFSEIFALFGVEEHSQQCSAIWGDVAHSLRRIRCTPRIYVVAVGYATRKKAGIMRQEHKRVCACGVLERVAKSLLTRINLGHQWARRRLAAGKSLQRHGRALVERRKLYLERQRNLRSRHEQQQAAQRKEQWDEEEKSREPIAIEEADAAKLHLGNFLSQQHELCAQSWTLDVSQMLSCAHHSIVSSLTVIRMLRGSLVRIQLGKARKLRAASRLVQVVHGLQARRCACSLRQTRLRGRVSLVEMVGRGMLSRKFLTKSRMRRSQQDALFIEEATARSASEREERSSAMLTASACLAEILATQIDEILCVEWKASKAKRVLARLSRALSDRMHIGKLRREKRRVAAATLMQSVGRGLHDRKALVVLRVNRKARPACATMHRVVKGFFVRRFVALKFIRRKRAKLGRAERDAAARGQLFATEGTERAANANEESVHRLSLLELAASEYCEPFARQATIALRQALTIHFSAPTLTRVGHGFVERRQLQRVKMLAAERRGRDGIEKQRDEERISIAASAMREAQERNAVSYLEQCSRYLSTQHHKCYGVIILQRFALLRLSASFVHHMKCVQAVLLIHRVAKGYFFRHLVFLKQGRHAQKRRSSVRSVGSQGK